MLGVGEHRVALLGNADATEAARQVGEIGDLDAGDVVEIAGIIAVAADAIGDLRFSLADARGNVGDLLMEAVPQPRNGGAVVAGDALGGTGDEECLCGFENSSL